MIQILFERYSHFSFPHPFALTNRVIVQRGRGGGPDNNSIDKYPPHLI
jgi:hypothetical protein